MIRRVFWVALGASAGLVVARQLRRTAASFTPAAMGTSIADSIRYFADQVREGMAEREAELRHELGLDDEPDIGATGARAGGSMAEHPFESRFHD